MVLAISGALKYIFHASVNCVLALYQHAAAFNNHLCFLSSRNY